MEREVKLAVGHLGEQFRKALPVLFTGAGFSCKATNTEYQEIPLGSALRRNLWAICFPGDDFDENSKLGDLYHHAAQRHPKQLTEVLVQVLSVRKGGLPHWYRHYFEAPWARIYTLNLDTAPEEANRAFDLARPLRMTSAVSNSAPYLGGEHNARFLQVVRLNGSLEDVPDRAVFSRRAFGERQIRPDPWYEVLAAEIVNRPFVFVGTELDEPSLWQHLSDRGPRGKHGNGELRPRSYLVTPKLEKSRLAVLSDLHVEWIPQDAEGFATLVLAAVAQECKKGSAMLVARANRATETPRLVDVSELSIAETGKSEYLLGAEPTWADLRSGRAVQRSADTDLRVAALAASSSEGTKPVIAVTGTAGSGKSTSLKRLALESAAAGQVVRWIDSDTEATLAELRTAIKELGQAEVYVVDDADLFGSELAPFLGQLTELPGSPLVLVGLRSGKFDRVLGPRAVSEYRVQEFVMPPLTDGDISGLLDLLSRERKLGVLREMPRVEQEQVFREFCGRELLVAMIGATSGKQLNEKVVSELKELPESEQRLYAIVGVATALRFALSRDELLIAAGDTSNDTLNSIKRLVGRGLLKENQRGEIRLRHRVLAEVLQRELETEGVLGSVLPPLVAAAAARVSPQLGRSARPWRLVKALINHAFLVRSVGLEKARDVYGDVEERLSWDSHFWLQRGSLEVEEGNLRLAQNYLGQALALAPTDSLVETEWQYLSLKLACENPGAVGAAEQAEEAMRALEGLIVARGKRDSYPYHVLGAQGLSWSRRAGMSKSSRADLLKRLLKAVQGGVENHPTMMDLKQLARDLKAEVLGLTARP